jgi:hypothetical protein
MIIVFLVRIEIINIYSANELVDTLLQWIIDIDCFKIEITRDLVINMIEFFVDLEIIQNVNSEKAFKFKDGNNQFYSFTEAVVGSKLTDQDFLDAKTINFEQFKIISQFISKPENIKDSFDKMMSPDGLVIKNRIHHLKVYNNVFIGAECVNWMKKAFVDLKLTKYGATVLGECLRQLGCFDCVTGDHPFQDKQLFYRMKDEETFLIYLLEYQRLE